MTPDELLLAAGVALPAALMIARLRENNHLDLSEPKAPPIGKRGPLDNALHPFREPLKLGNATVEFYEQHARMVAMSGGFKTTLMASIARQRIRQGRPVVIITGGDSDQLEAEVNCAGGWVIRPHESDLKFNAFEGTPEYMAQSWACMFPTTSEAKVYHSAFEIASMKYFRSTTNYSVKGLKDFILAYRPKNEDGEEVKSKLYEGMKDGYVGIRLELVEQAFGEWIGNELSVLDCVRRKVPLMFVLDASVDQDLNRFSAALVWQAVNYAVLESGNHTGLDCIVDELARLPAGLIGTQVRTWRRNQSHLVLGTHATDDFDPILHDLIHITCIGTLVAGAVKTRSDASNMTWNVVHPTNFGAHAMLPRRNRLHDLFHFRRQGAFYVADQERIQKVLVPTWKPVPEHQMKRRASMHGLNATAKHVLHAPAATQKDHPGAVPISKEGDTVRGTTPVRERWESGCKLVACGCSVVDVWAPSVEELAQRMHGPPECPPAYRTKRLLDFWERHFFPFGALDEKACWRVHLALKGKGQRPGLEYDGVGWTAYDLALALNQAVEQGMDEDTAQRYMAYVKLHLSTQSLSADHLCEDWVATEAKLCVRRPHLEWEDKLRNSELHWERLRSSKAGAAAVA